MSASEIDFASSFSALVLGTQSLPSRQKGRGEEMENDLDLAFTAIETAAVRLHANTPLFSGMAELAESDEWFRKELIRALLLSLDLIRREGAEVEETPLLARVRRAYTST